MKKILDKSVEAITIINGNNNKLPFVISIPHSGLYITKEMNDNLRDNVILSNSDWYLIELYSFLEELGFTVVINNINRYVIDPNRELKLDEGEDYSKSLIYLKTTFSKEIYKIKPRKKEIAKRISQYYNPYHAELQKQINIKLNKFDKVILIDLHSFGKNVNSDIVLGNNNHETMSKETFNKIKNCFENSGFCINENTPFRGGYITRKYGISNGKCESIQIELSYKKYIDNRQFMEEESPKVNELIMNICKDKLKETFISIINNF